MADQESGDELYPIAVLIDELKVWLHFPARLKACQVMTDNINSMMMFSCASTPFIGFPPLPLPWARIEQETS
jgi:hypothetical protein